MHLITVRIHDDLRTHILQLAKKHNSSMSEIIRQALMKAFDMKEKDILI